MSNPNALFLLADHIKLSLLERKRAQALNLDSDSQDGHISRSLEQFRDGLEALQAEQARLEEVGDATYGEPHAAAQTHVPRTIADKRGNIVARQPVSPIPSLACKNS